MCWPKKYGKKNVCCAEASPCSRCHRCCWRLSECAAGKYFARLLPMKHNVLDAFLTIYMAPSRCFQTHWQDWCAIQASVTLHGPLMKLATPLLAWQLVLARSSLSAQWQGCGPPVPFQHYAGLSAGSVAQFASYQFVFYLRSPSAIPKSVYYILLTTVTRCDDFRSIG